MKLLSRIPLFLLAFLLVACEGQEDSLIDDRLEDNPLPTAPTYTSGSADFSTFVALGNSLTAGLMDGALYDAGQANSYPAQLASVFAAAGGGTFNQPDINSVNGFNSTFSDLGSGVIAGRTLLDTSIPGPVPTQGELPTPFTGNLATLNNFGVPGVTVGDLLVPASPNPALDLYYTGRFASNPGTSTIIGDAVARQPSFVSLWIGSNDILGYAAGGAANEAILTSAADFNTRFNGVMATLLGTTTAEGVVSTVPLVTNIPFFRAVPYNAVPLTDQATVDLLNGAYAAYNAGLQQAVLGSLITQAEADRRTISFEVGANAFVMIDENLTDLSALTLPSYRQTEPTDLIPLTAATILPTGVGTQTPAGDELVITPEEQLAIATRTGEFNAIIAGAVQGSGGRFVLHDVNAGIPGLSIGSGIGFFADLFGLDGELGVIEDGVLLQPDFSPNGIFSTDGVHPNQRGYALLANEILDVIEANFGASLPRVDVLELPGVKIAL